MILCILGLDVGGGFITGSNAVITNCTINNNTAGRSAGLSTGNLTMTNSIILNNNAIDVLVSL